MNYNQKYLKYKKKYLKLKYITQKGGNHTTGIENQYMSCGANSLSQLLVEIPNVESYLDKQKFPNYINFLKNLRETTAPIIVKNSCDIAMKEIGYAEGPGSSGGYLSKIAPSFAKMNTYLQYKNGIKKNFPPSFVMIIGSSFGSGMDVSVQDLLNKEVKVSKIDNQKMIAVIENIGKNEPNRVIDDISDYFFMEIHHASISPEKINQKLNFMGHNFNLIGLTFGNVKHEMAMKNTIDGWRFYDDQKVYGPFGSLLDAYNNLKNKDMSWGGKMGVPGLLMYKKIEQNNNNKKKLQLGLIENVPINNNNNNNNEDENEDELFKCKQYIKQLIWQITNSNKKLGEEIKYIITEINTVTNKSDCEQYLKRIKLHMKFLNISLTDLDLPENLKNLLK